MYENKKIAAVIVAGGKGSRMNADIPKQFLKIDGKEMLVKTAEMFCANPYTDVVVIVTNAGHIEECKKILKESGLDTILTVGGKERQDSVRAGLKELPDDVDYVLIHDAARPFVTGELIEKSIREVLHKEAVICAVPVKDTIRMIKADGSTAKLDRKTLFAVQTPQTFKKNLIIDAYEKAYQNGFYGTDDASVAEAAGYTVCVIEGAYENIKITTREDLPKSGEIRVGTGFDVHSLVNDRKLFLGGVEIPFERGLLGHSDADVLLHAVMDALLGAAGCGDIGLHFPDTCEEYSGVSSLLLLGKTAEIIALKGFFVGNIDAVVIAEKPKIAPYVNDMIKEIARTLGINEDKINIKGTTTERLGFAGRGEGIAAQAICSIYKNM